jgi:hypothetical protein
MKRRRYIVLFVLVFCLCLCSTVYGFAETPVTEINNDSSLSGSVTPQDAGGNYGGSYISFNSNRTALWYSGNFSSANTWISASCKERLQWKSPLGGSWITEVTNPTVYSENVKYMATPTYVFPNMTWGYWRSTNYIVAYWPSNIIPSYLSGTVYSSQLYYEP